MLGLTFTLKRMERNKGTASGNYSALAETFPETGRIIRDETEHENSLLSMLDEERLRWARRLEASFEFPPAPIA